MKPSTEWWRYLAPLAVIAIIALLPVPAGLENHTWLYFAVFTGVIVGLILEPVPGAGTAVPVAGAGQFMASPMQEIEQ